MKKKIYSLKRTVLFILCLVLFLFAASIPYYRYNKKGYQYQNVQHKVSMVDSVKKDSLDAVFIGDSQVWAGVSPLQLFGEYGIASYNCCTSGQCSYDAYIILQDVLKNQNPKVVVMGTSALYTGPNSGNFYLSKIFPIFQYHDYSNVADKKFGDEKYLGAHLLTCTEPYTGNKDYMNSVTALQPMSSIQQQYLNAIKTLCDQKGIQFVLVTMPTGQNWNQGRHDAIQQWATANAVPYVDYNESDNFKKIGFDWNTDTRDGGRHLNVAGSKKIGDDLGNYLQTNYELQDHREDTNYKKWKKMYDKCKFYRVTK